MEEDDFESLLDAAFGIDSTQDDPSKAAAAACTVSGQQQQQQTQQYDSSSSLDPSPAASPVHMYPSWAPAGSPCLSDASMQMHASPLHDKSSSGAQQYDPQLLYSPVRQGSPSPDEGLSPVMRDSIQQHVDAAQQQHNSLARQHSQPQQSQADASSGQAQQRHLQTAVTHTAPPAPAQHARPASRHQHLSLCALPREVQMRVLCCLSADSLTSLTQTSCQFSSLCNEPVLWRRLFVHRWGKNVQHNNAQTWKVRYMDRDAAELQAAGAGAQDRDVMQDIFLQARKAQRHKALGIGAVDDLMLVEDDEVAARVLAWRKSRGFATVPGPSGDAQPQRPSDLALAKSSRGSGHSSREAAGLGAYGAAEAAAASSGRRRVVRRAGSVSGAGSGGGQSSRGTADAVAGAAGASAGVNSHKGLSPAAATQSAGCRDRQPTALTVPTAAQGGAQTAAAAAAAAGPAQGAAASGGSSSGTGRGVKRRRQPRRWTQIGNVFCDEQTGWVHVCDETCSEKIIEPSSGLLVCPISGTCSARLLTFAEEAAEEGDRDPDKEYREEDFGGERGRLARAFAAGYYCSDERELMRECGVYLPH